MERVRIGKKKAAKIFAKYFCIGFVGCVVVLLVITGIMKVHFGV